MKLCDKCGACNSDRRINCVDCSAPLGEKLSTLEEEKIRKSTDEKIEKLYNKKDPLFVSLYDKIFGILAVIGIAISVALMVVNYINNRGKELLFIVFLFLLIGAFEAFMPRLSWSIEKLRLSFSIDDADEAEPGVFYFYGRKIFITFTVVCGFAVLVTKFLGL